MAESISIYVGGQQYNFPQDRQKIRDAVYGDGRVPVLEGNVLLKALQLAEGLGSMQMELQTMFGDIQHDLFRLGKLGGLKGDAYQAYADQIGGAGREAKQRLLVGVLVHNVPVFQDDSGAGYMNILEPLSVSDRLKETDIRFIDSDLHIDWDGKVKGNDRSVFPQYGGRELSNWLGTLDTFFHPLLAEAGEGSLYDSLIRIAKFVFADDDTDPFKAYTTFVTHYSPYKESRAEVFLSNARSIVFGAIARMIGEWVQLGIIEKCPCIDRHLGVKQTHIFPDQFIGRGTIEGDVCPICNGFGMKFTDKIRTSKPDQGRATALPESYTINL